jgi:signal transduction histidine kinase
MLQQLRDPRVRFGLAASVMAATVVVALIGLWNLATWDQDETVPWTVEIISNVGAGLAFGIAGLVAMHRRPANRAGPLMVLIGASHFVWAWLNVPVPLLVTLGHWWSSAPVILLGILVLTYPSGRFTSGLARVWFVLALVYLFVIQLARTLVTPFGNWDCPDCRPLITLTYDERIGTTLWHLGSYVLVVLTAGLILLLVRRWLRATGPMRRQLGPLWLAGLGFTGVALTTTVLGSTAIAFDDFTFLPSLGRFIRIQTPEAIWENLQWPIAASLFLVPIALLAGLLRAQMGQAAVSALAVELGRRGDRTPLLESLRRALGDRSLELGLWSRPSAAYVTPDGLPLDVPEPDAGRGITRLEAEDGPLAVMIHDAALSDQRALVDGVSAVARLALENERLQAEVKAQLEEVRASRERIVSAADAERRRVERNLHDGAQQRLVSLALALRMAQTRATDAAPEVASALAQAEGELKRAIAELRELARGIHPAILSEAGLGPALESLADHSPVPVSVETDLDGRRLPAPVEGTAYFVAAEALTNVVKHAAASRAVLSATVDDGWLRLTIIDDGIGGADPARGSGLRGLADRVAALGGRLRIQNDKSGGTRLEAEIPCA